jgi:hypothetical protein
VSDLEEVTREAFDLIGVQRVNVTEADAPEAMHRLMVRLRKADRIAEERAQFALKLMRRLAEIAVTHPEIASSGVD